MKKVIYRKRPILQDEKKYRMIPVPQINHQSRKGWKNDAIAAYQDAFDQSIEEAPQDLAIPFPKNTFGERLKLGSKTTLVKTMFSLLSFFTKERGTHQNGGIGATGKIVFLDNEATSKLPFCDAGRELSITLRHSNASFEDDADSQVRAMAFRIEGGNEGDQDFILGTGAIVPFWSLTSLLNFAKYRGKVKDDNWEPQKTWLKDSPTAFISAIEAIRLAPESYTKMSYYSAIPYGINGTDEFVKFRVMPMDMDRESGLLTPEHQRKIWNQGRLDGNDKPQQYLADEFKVRLSKAPVKYTVEAQFRTLDLTQDSAEFFNLARYWEEDQYPWQPIGEIIADQVMVDRNTEKLAFWLGNMPEGLDFMEVYSADDYNSISTTRVKLYPTVQRLRKKKD
jgi:catalase